MNSAEGDEVPERVARSLSDPKSMVGASTSQVMAMIPDGWFVIPFADGRPGFQALDPGKLPGAYGVIAVHVDGHPLMRTLTGADDPVFFVLNSCWELPSLGAIAHDRSQEPDGSYTVELALETADAALLLFANKLVRVWEVDLLTGDPTLLDSTNAKQALSMFSNWKRDEADAAMPETRTVNFLDFTTKGRRAFERIGTKPLRLKVR
jgi:hypothetical protein